MPNGTHFNPEGVLALSLGRQPKVTNQNALNSHGVATAMYAFTPSGLADWSNSIPRLTPWAMCCRHFVAIENVK